LKLRLGLPLVVIAVLLAVAPVAEAQSLVRENCAPVTAEGGQLYFNERQPNGLFAPRVGNFDCTNDRPVAPPHDGHQGIGDIVGGRVLLETAVGPMRTNALAEPGRGLGNQLELLEGGVVRPLVTVRPGIIWSKLHPSGDKVMWAQMIRGGDWWHHILGFWEIHVADIVDGRIANERSWKHATDEGWAESYGWLDDDTVMFASDQGAPGNAWGDWLSTQLWTMPDTLEGAPTRWSAPFTVQVWDWASWSVKPQQRLAFHEFMHLIDGWVYFSVVWEYDLTGKEYDVTPPHNGLDLWRAHLDGSGRERVTSLNLTGFRHVGGLADAGDHIVAGVCSNISCDGDINAYRITP
jgi:hypothetical protein